MEKLFIEYSPENCKSDPADRKNETPARVHFNKNGAVTLSKKAEELLGVKVGDRIRILQDPEDPRDFRFSRVDGEETGFELKQHGRAALLSFVNASIVRKIRAAHQGESFSGNFNAYMAGVAEIRNRRRSFALLVRTVI